MTAEVRIAFDGYSLIRYKVDQKSYQDKLEINLPEYSLLFTIAPDSPMSVGFPFAINMLSGINFSSDKVMNAVKEIWPSVINTAYSNDTTEL
ncbi:hypothetical protein [Janthinobacterium sp. NKUCC06_STL]|uniref:hypothetical protein n=1 Tax=Janthinobacterium sp. NKUCC06_STL TaxID=2842127 RepID=UPI001C5B0156|nr:hypothetical protein [Janthinobacterium sp. NKUCC06_STL]MBW3510611.1 hypothetical protein [Janthinobacterium sp. NKUCC06_STL]